MTTKTGSDLQEVYEAAAREFARRVRGAMGDRVYAVVLYGSVARRTAADGSDIDVLVLADDPAVDECLSDMYRVDDASPVLLAAHTCTTARLKDMLSGGFPFARRVLHEGIVLADDGTFEGLRASSRALIAKWRERMGDPTNEYIKSRFELAERTLDDAKFLQTAQRLEAAADRAYYSLFHSAEAALALRGVEPGKTHSGVHSQFSEHLVRARLLDKSYAAELKKAKEIRESSTYGGQIVLHPETVAHMIHVAEDLLARAIAMADEKRR